jgi:hypothetical protein
MDVMLMSMDLLTAIDDWRRGEISLESSCIILLATQMKIVILLLQRVHITEDWCIKYNMKK